MTKASDCAKEARLKISLLTRFHLQEMSKNGKSIDTEGRMVLDWAERFKLSVYIFRLGTWLE